MKHDSIYNLLVSRFAEAIAEITGIPVEGVEPAVRPAGDPKFGDYQCNAAMALAKRLKSKPRDVAQQIKASVEPRLADMIDPLEIAGPGFLNIRLKDEFLARYLSDVPAPPTDGHVDRVGIAPVENPIRVVVDYSSPNIAKQMHVGHLRSTIIGDAFARVLECEGHEVIRQNHIGDWGTQFGMLIRYYREHPLPTEETHGNVLAAIEADYKAAHARFKKDEQFAAESRAAVGALQSGDPDAKKTWERLCALSRGAFLDIYQRLNVLLNDDDVRGESFYNDKLADVVDTLRNKLAPPTSDEAKAGGWVELRTDQGAECLFFYDEKGESRFKNPDGDPLPEIVRKTDGAFLYATTDLAAVRFRTQDLGARRIIYVTDAGQSQHFQMLFFAAKAAGWAEGVRLEHVPFGSVLGTDRKKLKTRSGDSVKLRDLLDEAEQRAYDLITQRESEGEADRGQAAFTEAEKREVARRVGIGAVKYADLSRDRVADYVFNWDTMLAMQGNTAPYMLYAYARIRSIYRKAAEKFGSPDVYGESVAIGLREPAERALALRLARLREAIDNVASDLTPHTLCSYLYELAADFMRFYESCPVLQAPDEAARLSRMRLCDLTARSLRLGLGLLGIEVIERM